MTDALIVSFENRDPMTLCPVPMPFMPSEDPAKWLAFLRNHVSNTSLDLSEQKEIVQFMRKHKTEALTDGRRCYTLAGESLAICDPIRAVYGFSLGSGWFELEGAAGWFVRGESSDGVWMEANLVGEELLIKVKRNGELGGVMMVASAVFEARANRDDQKAIDAALADAVNEMASLFH